MPALWWWRHNSQRATAAYQLLHRGRVYNTDTLNSWADLDKKTLVYVCWSQRLSGSSASCVSECSAVELEQLMTLRGRDAVDKIHDDYGGLEQLCRRLGTDPVNGR